MMQLFLPSLLALALPHAPLAEAHARAEAATEAIVVDAREEAGRLVISIGHERYTLEGLGALLRRRVAGDPDLSVRIRGAADMAWQRMADVISTCSQAGVWNISFSKQMPGGKDAAAGKSPSTPTLQP